VKKSSLAVRFYLLFCLRTVRVMQHVKGRWHFGAREEEEEEEEEACSESM
jgi:hypothetical protein